MDGNRVLKTGGPLSVWRKEAERQGQDIPTALATGLRPEDLTAAIEVACAKLEEEHRGWTLSDVVQNLDWCPVVHCSAKFRPKKGFKVSYWILGINERIIPVASWSPSEGFLINPSGILKVCAQKALESVRGENRWTSASVLKGRKGTYGIRLGFRDSISFQHLELPLTLGANQIRDYDVIYAAVSQTVRDNRETFSEFEGGGWDVDSI